MPDTTGSPWNFPLPVPSTDFFKGGATAVRNLGNAIAAAMTDLATRVTAREARDNWPAVQLRATAVQGSIPLGWQPILMDVVDFQVSGAVGFAANRTGGTRDSRWTCPAGQGGTYAVEGACTFSNIAAGANFNSGIRKNGAAIPNSWANNNYGVANNNVVGTSTGRHLITLAPGDYVELWAYYSAGTWSTFYAADAGPFLT